MKHHDLPKVIEVCIEDITLSDHAPVSIEVELLTNCRPPFQWRLNESLLLDTVTLSELTTEMKPYFETNPTLDSGPMIVCEAHKPVVRGIMIKHGARLKRVRVSGVLKNCPRKSTHLACLTNSHRPKPP